MHRDTPWRESTRLEVGTMWRLDHIAVLVTLLLTIAFGTGMAAADATKKHSGAIVATDEGKAAFVLAEVGPWQLRDGNTVLTNRTVVVTDTTEWTVVKRAEATPSGFPWDFVEATLDRWDVHPGTFVTADCLHKGKALIATKVTVVELPAK
jgi:hypothetical protein